MNTLKSLPRNETIVAVFAHPDDEAFGPSGTLAKLTEENSVFVLCATKGEAGGLNPKIAKVRESELRKSAKILGIKKVYFLGYIDGSLSNSLYHNLASKIREKLEVLKPSVLITFEIRGISGHLDHIAVSLTTTFVFNKLKFIKKLMYYCIDEKASKLMQDYFIFFPKGYKRNKVDQIVDISGVWNQKLRAMYAHKSQINDLRKILTRIKSLPREEYFLIYTK